MRESGIPVTFQPKDTTVFVIQGTALIEAASDADIILESPCGGDGRCGKCRVILEPAAEPTAAELRVFSAAELQAGCRLACQATVQAPMTVLIPQASLVGSHHKILTTSEDAALPDGDPIVSKRYVELPAPERGSDDPDAIRLEKAIGPFEADLDLLRELPQALRLAEFRGTAVLAGRRLLDFESGNTEWDGYGVAVDVGTTTLVGSLLDLTTGRETRVTSRLNPQQRSGDDVLARILYARDQVEGLEQLRRAIADAIDEMIGELCREAEIPRERVYLVTVAGNTTMEQLFCGIDPSGLGHVPFVPAIGRGLDLPAAGLGLHIHPHGRVYVLPVIGGFVGGDIVAGVLATGLADCTKPTLLIDIGTNGEIVLLVDGKLLAASTAAGPAFEGARISQGMRASAGAIEKIVVDGRLRIQVIGNVPPIGLCGSALIDAAAELLRHGILTPQGRLPASDELPKNVHPDLARRVIVHGKQTAFVLADDEEAAGGCRVLLTQRDFRELQLATGAIRAGVVILLRRCGLTPKDLDRVFLGGGFGNYIRADNAQRIGLLPGEIEHRRIRYRGNTSLAGARLVTLSQRSRELAEELAACTEHVDLSFDPGFQTAFAEAMLFPE